MIEPSEEDRKAAKDLGGTQCSCDDLAKASWVSSDCDDCIARFRAQARASERERVIEECAKVAEIPYSDTVQCFGGDEPMAVGKKIAAVGPRLAHRRGDALVLELRGEPGGIQASSCSSDMTVPWKPGKKGDCTTRTAGTRAARLRSHTGARELRRGRRLG
jgi:hypothetical protein